MLHSLKDLVVNTSSVRPVGYAIGRYYGDLIPHRGCVIETPVPQVPSVVKARIRWGFYERTELRMIAKHLAGDHDVVELGASLGVVSCHIARKLQPGRRLRCVEGDSAMVPLIEANLTRNTAGTDWKVINRAVLTIASPAGDAAAWVSPAALGYGAVLAVFCTMLPSFMLSEAIARIGAGRASAAGNIGPVVTAGAAVLVLHEPFGPAQAGGLILITFGVGMLARRRA